MCWSLLAGVIRSLGIQRVGVSLKVLVCGGAKVYACVWCGRARLGVSGCLGACAGMSVQGDVVEGSPHGSLCICEYDSRGFPRSLTQACLFTYF